MELPLTHVPVVFAKIRGKKGVRELKAIISPASDYTIITMKDALQLGYPARSDRRGGGVSVITPGGIMKAAPLIVDEIAVGNNSAKNVECLSYELPEPAGVDVILGETFLQYFLLTYDYDKNILRMEPRTQNA